MVTEYRIFHCGMSTSCESIQHSLLLHIFFTQFTAFTPRDTQFLSNSSFGKEGKLDASDAITVTANIHACIYCTWMHTRQGTNDVYFFCE